MRDRDDIREVWHGASARGEAVVLMTLVRTEGSFYRKPGARLLLLESGETRGLISGGCLEADLCERAQDVRRKGTPQLVHMDLTGDDEIYLGYGTGCPGKIWVLLEPLSGLSTEERDLALGIPTPTCDAMALIYRADSEPHLVGARFQSWHGQWTGLETCPPQMREIIHERAMAQQFGGKDHEILRDDGSKATYGLFIEPMVPTVHLYLFGAGPDAQAVYDVGVAIGWSVSVFDHRPALLQRARFPAAKALALATYDHSWTPPLMGPRTPCVVMTHNLPRDLDLIPQLLRGGAPYVGVLGAKKRTTQLRQKLFEVGLTSQDLGALFSPIGLDLGAQDPWTIALATLAEIQAVLAGASPRHLREVQIAKS